MTKAKRYEGEQRRSEEWHRSLRDLAWRAIDEHQYKLQQIIKDYHKSGYVLRHNYIFHPDEMTYMVRTMVYRGKDQQGTQSWSGDAVFIHDDPHHEFPSDHLKTKLLLLAG